MTMKPEDIPFVGELSDNLMLSGGAKGADCYWAQAALAAGHQVIHWSFEGHKSHDPDNTVKLDEETLKEADIRLEMANETLKRRIPYYKPWIINLLRRNWYQVRDVNQVWAVGKMKDGIVQGGTAWATQMFMDLHQGKYVTEEYIPTLFFFDQEEDQLYYWGVCVSQLTPIPNSLNHPTGIYAAIGTRDLNDVGKAFIDSVFTS